MNGQVASPLRSRKLTRGGYLFIQQNDRQYWSRKFVSNFPPTRIQKILQNFKFYAGHFSGG